MRNGYDDAGFMVWSSYRVFHMHKEPHLFILGTTKLTKSIRQEFQYMSVRVKTTLMTLLNIMLTYMTYDIEYCGILSSRGYA